MIFKSKISLAILALVVFSTLVFYSCTKDDGLEELEPEKQEIPFETLELDDPRLLELGKQGQKKAEQIGDGIRNGINYAYLLWQNAFVYDEKGQEYIMVPFAEYDEKCRFLTSYKQKGKLNIRVVEMDKSSITETGFNGVIEFKYLSGAVSQRKLYENSKLISTELVNEKRLKSGNSEFESYVLGEVAVSASSLSTIGQPIGATSVGPAIDAGLNSFTSTISNTTQTSTNYSTSTSHPTTPTVPDYLGTNSTAPQTPEPSSSYMDYYNWGGGTPSSSTIGATNSTSTTASSSSSNQTDGGSAQPPEIWAKSWEELNKAAGKCLQPDDGTQMCVPLTIKFINILTGKNTTMTEIVKYLYNRNPPIDVYEKPEFSAQSFHETICNFCETVFPGTMTVQQAIDKGYGVVARIKRGVGLHCITIVGHATEDPTALIVMDCQKGGLTRINESRLYFDEQWKPIFVKL